MSVKIHEAFRCPIDRINDTIDFCHENMTEIVVDFIEDCMFHVKPEVIGDYPEHIKNEPEEVKNLWERIKRADFIFDLCKESAKSSCKSFTDIECGLNIWIYDGYVYLVPIASNMILNKYKIPDWCEEYHYQDQSDRPKNISMKKWEQRRQIWEEVCLKSHNKRRLFHEIISAKSDFDLIDLRWRMKNDPISFWESVKDIKRKIKKQTKIIDNR